MKKLILTAILAVVAVTAAFPQTAAEIVAKSLYARNAPVCEAFGLDPTCTDSEAQAAWCVTNRKPAGAMCVASDTRSAAERVLTAAQLYAEKQAEQDKLLLERARRLRKATLVLIEIAIANQATRDAVCAAAGIPARECN